MNEFEKACEKADEDYDGMMANENAIEWLRGSAVATITTCQVRYINRLKKYAKEYPDLFEIVSERDGVVVAHIPVKSIKITHVTPREMSEEEKELARERLAMYREQKALEEKLKKEEAFEEEIEEDSEDDESDPVIIIDGQIVSAV